MSTRRRFIQGLWLAVAGGLIGCSRAGTKEIPGASGETADDPAAGAKKPIPTFTTEGTVLDGQAVEVDLPLLHRVHELDSEMTRNRTPRFDSGFGYLGLLLAPQLKNEGYWCTPKNSLAFGGTGGDGFHFSFVATGGRIDGTSPIVGSAPDYSADPPLANVILAANFENFLRLGLTRGYFGMRGFVHQPREAMAAYGSADWEPSDSSDEAAGFGIDDRKREITRNIATALNLAPLTYSEAEFQDIQDEYKPLLRFK